MELVDAAAGAEEAPGEFVEGIGIGAQASASHGCSLRC
jgi:hypothetical protein